MKKIAKMLGICLLLSLELTGCRKETDTVEKEYIKKSEITETKVPSYAAETCYNGASIPLELFQYPFQKTDEGYTKNKEYIKLLSEEAIQAMYGASEKFTKLIFGNNYRSIIKKQDLFQQELREIYSLDGNVNVLGTQYTMEEHITNIFEWYVDNQASMDVKFISDRSLIFKDYYIYPFLRGAVEITCHSKTGAEGMVDLFGIEIEKDKPVTLIIDFEFEPNEYEIIGSTIVAQVE